MASSSSSSSSVSWNYDVFMSFRGEDTRKNFVDHLHTALVAKNIRTYKDDETLDRGEVIAPALLKAIRESRIAVVVFSENYADSSWCLDELAYIIKCKETRGQIVMPVFYNVDPSDVRRQNGKYGEAFIKHEAEHKDKVELWRNALVKSANLSGWPKDFADGHEAKLIKEIVGTIYKKLSPIVTNINEDLIGIETRLQDLESILEIGLGGVRIVGIWGVGGGGKTTLASAAYREFYRQFDAHCLLLNIRDESNKNGLKSLQENILSSILKETMVLGNEVDGKSTIKKMLSNKSVLVVLDDIDDLKQLKALVGSHDWFGEGSRIIITTRDAHLLNYCEADVIYEVSLLSKGEALELFNRHAYRKDKPVEDYETLSLEVVSYSGGLPLALEVLGSYLCDKNKEEWISAMEKLIDIPDNEVTQRLKISYDGLESYQQELFLDIACFWRRREKDEAMKVLDACCFHPVIGIKVLVQKSLIKISDGVFDMHDLVEEMAHYIVIGEHPNQPEKHSRIWQYNIEEHRAMWAETYSRIWENIYDEEDCAMRAETFMENNHTEVFASRWYGELHPPLHDIVSSMKKLRWIDLGNYPEYSFPVNFNPTNLRCLELRISKLGQLWQGCKYFPHLKHIDLTLSSRLKSTPDFTGLPSLETLILDSCNNLESIHPSIGCHERLVLVSMRRCTMLTTFPPIIRMKMLETLDFYRCLQLEKFPDIQSYMDSLVDLNLYHTDIDMIPPSVGQFCTNLVSLDLSCCSLKRIEGNFRLLKHLKMLDLSYCVSLERLARDFFDKECCLEVLNLCVKSQDSTSFRIFMNQPVGLQCLLLDSSVSLKLPQFPRFLKKLGLACCYLEDGDIPTNIIELSNLQVLDLSSNNFTRLHSSLSGIPCLKFLDLSDCESLVELPNLPSSIAVLKATGCKSLESLGDLSDYKWLWKVSFKRCNKLIGGERQLILDSILQGNAVADRLMSVTLPLERESSSKIAARPKTNITLQLPHNWYSDFSGFLFSADTYGCECTIVFEHKTYMNSQPVHEDQNDKFNQKQVSSSEYARRVCYVPFASLRHTKWWNSAYTLVPGCKQDTNVQCFITFEIEAWTSSDPKVELVPRKSKTGDSSERPIDPSEFWDEEYKDEKTFALKEYPVSSTVSIRWHHTDY